MCSNCICYLTMCLTCSFKDVFVCRLVFLPPYGWAAMKGSSKEWTAGMRARRFTVKKGERMSNTKEVNLKCKRHSQADRGGGETDECSSKWILLFQPGKSYLYNNNTQISQGNWTTSQLMCPRSVCARGMVCVCVCGRGVVRWLSNVT